jgi:hypothetical protein
MAQTAPSKAVKQPLGLPDERFWKRYSPHGEMPLSGAGSLALHLLVLGLLVLGAWLAAAWFNRGNRSLPVETVRFNPGGGGGNPHGRGEGSANGKVLEENGKEEGAKDPEPANTEKRPNLKTEPSPKTPLKFDNTTRLIFQNKADGSRAFTQLAQANVRIRLPDAKPAGYGKGGTGEGGGSGDGKGKGTGDARGEGTSGKLTQREKRMLRWSMLFNTANAPDYLSQLKGLGAILAIPVKEDASGREYRIVRDLGARPAKLLEEDISKIQRIYWIDDNLKSVGDVMTVLGVRLRAMPSHFVAFMPEELEAKLFKIEKAYLAKHHKRLTEDDIVETKFRIERTGRGFEPKVESQKVK